ncbi:MAG: RdgB/HAM1 family non-canonical purine NTP pyrophosphatase [Armatimonadetes bacterium]|nr:RdgB/HAM1 family non-canonical purine NTP pyrophosphatase [Armatimonadota bacterium]
MSQRSSVSDKNCRSLTLATSNAHKIREIRAMFADSGWVVRAAPPELPDIEETGATFAENARIKALAVASATGEMTLADDSGLVVDALNGQPGTQSRRWAGEHASDTDRIALLLQRMADVPDGLRTARFVCAACVADACGALWETSAAVEGIILREPRGNNGFGYDPVFFLPDLGLTMAELDENKKNAVSHRSLAMRQVMTWLTCIQCCEE